MINNACIHINGEQPVVADLFDMPASNDQGLRCTNLRTLDGKRPVFVDDQYSVFFFTSSTSASSRSRRRRSPRTATSPCRSARAFAGVANPAAALPPEEDLEIDEDFLRRIREV